MLSPKHYSKQTKLTRFYFRNIFSSGTSDTGPRGVGKTTYLLHHAQRLLEAQQEKILYLSADNPMLVQVGDQTGSQGKHILSGQI